MATPIAPAKSLILRASLRRRSTVGVVKVTTPDRVTRALRRLARDAAQRSCRGVEPPRVRSPGSCPARGPAPGQGAPRRSPFTSASRPNADASTGPLRPSKALSHDPDSRPVYRPCPASPACAAALDRPARPGASRRAPTALSAVSVPLSRVPTRRVDPRGAVYRLIPSDDLVQRVHVIVEEAPLPSWMREPLRRFGFGHGEMALRDLVVLLVRAQPPRPLIGCAHRRRGHGVRQ